MYKLKNKVFIVTGAGSGMGRELTLQLIKKGVKVAACDINEKTLEETKSLASDPLLIKAYVLDVSKKENVDAFPKIVKDDFLGLDGVINNAGIIQPFVKFADLPDSAVDRVMNINLYGVINLTRAVLKELDPNTDSFIVNTSSMGGFLPVPGQSIYGASKAGVKLFTEALYGEMIGTKIHVSAVFPGAIATNIVKNSLDGKDSTIPQSKAGKKYKMINPDVAADIIIRGIEKGKPRIFVGKDSKLMDKLYRLIPVKSINMMAKRINKMIS